MAGIGICPPCQAGEHRFHREFFTDLSNVTTLFTSTVHAESFLGRLARKRVEKALKNNRRCDCPTCVRR